jgi:hypothetical protein
VEVRRTETSRSRFEDEARARRRQAIPLQSAIESTHQPPQTWYINSPTQDYAPASILTTPIPAFHLRRQLPRTRPRLALPQILLRPRTPSLHATHVEIPHPQDRAHRQPRRKANQQSRRRIGGNDDRIRLERTAAEQHQETQRYGNVSG